MKVLILFLTAFLTQVASANVDKIGDLSDVATNNLKQLELLKSGDYCKTRSLPPADMPDISKFSGLELTRANGSKAKIIPLKEEVILCDRSMNPHCGVRVTALMTEKTKGKAKMTVQELSVRLHQNSGKFTWEDFKTAKKITSESFFSSAGGWESQCALPRMIRTEGKIVALFQGTNDNKDEKDSNKEGAKSAK